MENRPSIKRFLLYLVVGGLVLAALIGIYVLLFGTFGRREVKILLTTLGISYFSVTSLACAAAYEKRGNGLLSLPGLALSVIGLALFLPGLWADWLEIDSYGKTTAIIAIFSFSFAHICLLSFATLQRHLAWVYHAAVGSIMALAAIVTVMILYDKGDWLLRLAGAVGILDGCLSLCIPILHRLGGSASLPTTVGNYERIELVCPRCGQGGVYAVGSIKCRRCSLAIEVKIGTDSHGPG
ncbi:MAG: hypothetical protein ACLP9L_32670 [Thermoguttaceae bacterium]